MPSRPMRPPREALRALPVLTGLVALALLGARSPAAQQLSAPRIKAEVNLVLLDATVKDKVGHIITSLKKEDFQLDREGQGQQISHFSQNQLPLAVALVVQLNSWMQPFMPPLRYATQSILRALKSEDQVALFTFDDEVQRRVDLTADKRRVAEALAVAGRGMGTNINDAVYEAAKYLQEEAPTARRVILLVSDNMPAECKQGASHEKVLNSALAADAVVYSLKLPYRGPFLMTIANRLTEHWLINVSKLTAETGGEVVDLEKEGSLYLALQTILTRLKTRYTVGFYPTPNLDDGAFHHLNLQLAPSFGRNGRDYQVLARIGYFAPAAGNATQ